MTPPDLSDLPNRRQSIQGTDLDGNSVTLAFTISKKLYRCPGCHDYIPIGTEHTLVRYETPTNRYHQHWHHPCAHRAITRLLRSLQRIDT